MEFMEMALWTMSLGVSVPSFEVTRLLQDVSFRNDADIDAEKSWTACGPSLPARILLRRTTTTWNYVRKCVEAFLRQGHPLLVHSRFSSMRFIVPVADTCFARTLSNLSSRAKSPS